MSCVLSYLCPDRVHLFTDRAFYSQDGKVAFFASKCFQIHDQPMVIAGRGFAAETFAAMENILSLTAGRDTMKVGKVLEIIREYFRRQEPTEAEFLIACATQLGAMHYLVNLHGRSPYAAFELFSPPVPIGAHYTWVHQGPQITLPPSHYVAEEQTDFPALGLEVMERMRKEAGALNEATVQYHLIGGGIDYTTVDSKGVNTVRLKDWPDQLGELINP